MKGHKEHTLVSVIFETIIAIFTLPHFVGYYTLPPQFIHLLAVDEMLDKQQKLSTIPTINYEITFRSQTCRNICRYTSYNYLKV